MAKKDTAAPEATQDEALKALLESMSPEEREALLRLTGQSNSGGGGLKTPKLKINYKEKAGQDGKKVAKGNFVIGQESKTEDGKKVLVTAGTDLGNRLEAIILKVGNQYSYWSENAKFRCSSQIITEKGEVAVGSTLKKKCAGGECPRREQGCDKKERCTNQYVVFFRLPTGTKLPDGTDCPIAMMYIKGTSYKPFQEYLQNEIGSTPTIAVSTVMTTTEEEQGSTLYYPLVLEKGRVVPAEVFKDCFDKVRSVDEALKQYKEANASKNTAAAPPAPDKEEKGADAPAPSETGAGPSIPEDDDQIPW